MLTLHQLHAQGDLKASWQCRNLAASVDGVDGVLPGKTSEWRLDPPSRPSGIVADSVQDVKRCDPSSSSRGPAASLRCDATSGEALECSCFQVRYTPMDKCCQPTSQGALAAPANPLTPPSIQHLDSVRTPLGGTFTGQVNDHGRPHGHGVHHYPNGAVYDGEWSEGLAQGEGRLRFPNGNGYQGAWRGGFKHGQGHERYESGAEYDGRFENGVKEGTGTFSWPNETNYHGDFHRGQIHGEGRFRWPDKREYNGQWVSGIMHGVGKLDWPDGRSYTGHYQEGQKHGAGVYSWPDGSKCKGRWEHGKMHGSGTYVDPAGNSRHGRWALGECQYWTE